MPIVYGERKLIIVAAVVLTSTLIIGVLIGYYSGQGNPSAEPDVVNDRFVMEQALVKTVLNDVNTNNLRSYLRILTKKPHIAAEKRDKELMDWIKNEWEGAGLDEVRLSSYDILFSRPNPENPNKIYLIDGQGEVMFTSKHKESVLLQEDDDPDFIHAFNAYSPFGDVSGQLVFVNYGRIEDLELLETMNVSLKGKIAISRYGKIFRGNRLKNCHDKGAIGVIQFSDPADVALLGTNASDVYPHSIFLPGSGIQRGSTLLHHDEPLSPGWPSVENAYRLTIDDVLEDLPQIPCQPIGYDDAKVLLEKMGGLEPPNDRWKGGIVGVDYKLGGEFLPKYSQWKVRLVSHNYLESTKDTNVIGFIRGEEEPDRYVFLSNHRDAWGYGAVDPSTGTAQLMEVVRVLGNLKMNHNWRPKRTIVFCSWAAEEYGLLGSSEWVSEKVDKLMSRGVGLVNTDVCVSGPIAKADASAVLTDIVAKALKMASPPPGHESHENYYNFWKSWWNQGNESSISSPEVSLLGAGSDHAPFAFYTGIPSVYVRFKDDYKLYKGIGQYPMYHTGFETFGLMDKIIDPGFKLHRICAQTSIHMLMNLADSLILPYNISIHPVKMRAALTQFESNGVAKKLESFGATLRHIISAVDTMETAIHSFQMRHKNIHKMGTIVRRMYNDQLMQVERVFIMPGGIPGRPDIRHAVYSPSVHNQYGESVFPGITDLLYDIDLKDTKSQALVKRHLSDLMIIILNVASFLEPVELI